MRKWWRRSRIRKVPEGSEEILATKLARRYFDTLAKVQSVKSSSFAFQESL